MPLTEKQEVFCQRYLIDFNATQAAKDSGYSPETAYAIGWENLRKPEIQARIKEIREEMSEGFNITRERIAQELARIGFFDIRNIFDKDGLLKSPENWSDDVAACIAGLESEQIFEWVDKEKVWTGYLKKVKVWEKVKALDALSKLMGYNAPDQHEHKITPSIIDFSKG